jgi:membrane-bound lytic murein transglycosylase D
MRINKLFLSLPLLGAVILTTACEQTGQSKGRAQASAPPPNANAPTITAKQEAPKPKPEAQTPTPAVDPVDGLIATVEKEYQKGQANYKAGHLEAAKNDFDRAFNMMLQGPMDIHSDERLEREFDKVVEAVNNLELLALKEGDGFTEQRSEPAPIDEANDVTFPVDPNVKAKAEVELRATHSDLPLVMNDRVASFISFFSSTKGRYTLEGALARAGRYREMISTVLKDEGVPQDLIYLAQAESGFRPLALSRAGARGMWQFMASRASGYGLERNWWVDERQDPEKATRAAARHLKDLYNQFGDWYLAMAAYNSGPGTVQRAVQRTGYADFWELYRRDVLPQETRNYVPIIVAVTIMAKNPAQYGLEHVVPDAAPKFETVKINYPVDLRLVAECADTSVSVLQDLNPSLLRMTTPKDMSFDLKLPAGSSARYQEAIAAIPQDMRVLWRYHKVQPGETLGDIARKYHTTAKAISEANNLTDDDLSPESKLIIPVTAGGRKLGDDSETLAFSKHATRYKVRKGDTVLSVADDFSVPVERLRKWNHISGNQLKAGRTILIYKPVAAAEPSGRSVASKSKKPTTVAKGSKSKKVVDADEEDDDDPALDAKPQKKGKLVPAAEVKKGAKPAKTKTHKVRPGETLSSIATEYNTTVAQLKKDNGKAAKNLQAGSVLVIR